MTPDRELAWARLEALAQRLLEHPKDLEPREPIRRYGSLLRLWHFPSQGPQTTWTILTPGKKAPAESLTMVREVVWDRPTDESREPSVQPTLRVRDANLSAPETLAHLEAGKRLAVPPLVFDHAVGLDGDYFGLETFETSPFVRVQWWNDGPPEWRHFVDWVSLLRKWLIERMSC